MSDKDAKIRNVGPKSAAWLRQVGVRTAEDLFRIGPVDVFLKVKRRISDRHCESWHPCHSCCCLRFQWP